MKALNSNKNSNNLLKKTCRNSTRAPVVNDKRKILQKKIDIGRFFDILRAWISRIDVHPRQAFVSIWRWWKNYRFTWRFSSFYIPQPLDIGHKYLIINFCWCCWLFILIYLHFYVISSATSGVVRRWRRRKLNFLSLAVARKIALIWLRFCLSLMLAKGRWGILCFDCIID